MVGRIDEYTQKSETKFPRDWILRHTTTTKSTTIKRASGRKLYRWKRTKCRRQPVRGCFIAFMRSMLFHYISLTIPLQSQENIIFFIFYHQHDSSISQCFLFFPSQFVILWYHYELCKRDITTIIISFVVVVVAVLKIEHNSTETKNYYAVWEEIMSSRRENDKIINWEVPTMQWLHEPDANYTLGYSQHHDCTLFISTF